MQITLEPGEYAFDAHLQEEVTTFRIQERGRGFTTRQLIELLSELPPSTEVWVEEDTGEAPLSLLRIEPGFVVVNSYK